MQELRAEEFEKIFPLCRNLQYCFTFVHSVLERNNQGRIFVDNSTEPTVAVVAIFTFFVFVGEERNEEFNQSIERTLGKTFDDYPLFILCATTEAWKQTLAQVLSERFTPYTRRSFRFNPLKAEKRVDRNWRDKIPSGFQMEKIIDNKRYRKLNFFEETFFETGLGYCLWAGEDIVSLCYSALVGLGQHEIQIETAEKYQRKGYATLTGMANIERCLEKDITPHWDCDTGNKASLSLADKLGFEKDIDYPIFVWKKEE